MFLRRKVFRDAIDGTIKLVLRLKLIVKSSFLITITVRMSIIYKQIKYSGILDGITSYMLLIQLNLYRQIELKFM